MAKPIFHAESSARRFGGKPEDYLPLHDFMDSSKGSVADNRHRALTHNAWFLSNVIERVFGHYLTVTLPNGRQKKVSTREVAEQHVLEDYGGRFIPTAQDFLAKIPIEAWMDNGKGDPPSHEAISMARAAIERRNERIHEGAQADRVPGERGAEAGQVFLDGRA
jgi:hypothetical protein